MVMKLIQMKQQENKAEAAPEVELEYKEFYNFEFYFESKQSRPNKETGKVEDVTFEVGIKIMLMSAP